MHRCVFNIIMISLDRYSGKDIRLNGYNGKKNVTFKYLFNVPSVIMCENMEIK